MGAMKRYENSGGWVALTFMLIFFSMAFGMGYASKVQHEQQRKACEVERGLFVSQPRSESFCVK